MERRLWGLGRCEKGFTLLEVLVAVSILTVGLLAVASMQGSASRNNVYAGSRTVAATWASDQMEDLLSLSWNDPLLSDADGDGAAGLSDVGFDNDPATQGDADHEVTRGKYSIYWNVVDNQVATDTKTINVIVTWSDYGLKGRVSMERVIARVV